METFSAPPRPEVPTSGPERPQLEAWLDFHRATLLHKCDGLNAAQLKERPLATSTLSLLGMIRHMTRVEQVWFEIRFGGRDKSLYYSDEGDRDADFNDLESASLEEVIDLYFHSLKVSREIAKDHELDQLTKKPGRTGHVDLRWIYLHMSQEYARHCGHADLLREMIDGKTGY